MLTGVDGVRICDRCALRRHLDQVIPAQPAGALAGLRPAILAAEPLTTRRWLTRTRSLLVDLNEGRIRLDHAVLDDLPHRKSVDHLRALLIAVGILPPDPTGKLRRLEADLDSLLDDLDEPHRKIVTRWVRWKVLPRLRRRHDQGRDLDIVVRNARRQIRQAAEFLTTLQQRQRTLADLTQHDIDDWFSTPSAMRWDVRAFLAWAQHNRHIPRDLSLPPGYQSPRAAPIDAEERWRIAKNLLNDEDLDPVDRVAGALVTLYAQPLSRIVTLTTSDVIVTNGQVQLRLGPDPLELPEPLATLIQTLPRRRRASTVEQMPTPWLFAGSHAGKHLSTSVLGVRLRNIGIEPRRMRVTATDQLAREIPPAVLADVLGLRAAAAVRAARQTGGDWATYAADRQD
jgi:hypothetical protein